MQCKAVIFDLFGTLIDNYSLQEHKRVLSEMAAALCAPHDEFVRLWLTSFDQRATGVYATTQANIEHVCRVLGLRPQPGQVAAAAEVRLDFTWRHLVPRSGALETLARFRSAGHKIGLISDCSSEVPTLWKDTPFAPLVDVPVFSCAVGMKKPDPLIYRLACERLAVAPQDCLYVGDGSSRELTGAAEVGTHPVLIRVPHEDGQDAHRLDPEEWQGPTISELAEVLAYAGIAAALFLPPL